MVRIVITENYIESDDLRWLVVVAIDNESVVGSCQVTAWASECPLVGYLHIKPEERGKGIGTLLIQTLAAYAKVQGKRSLTLAVNKQNDAAERLYRKLGFVQFYDDGKQRWLSIALNHP